MQVKTHLLAFLEDRIRMVEIDDRFKSNPNVMEVLEAVFEQGQNDFQPQPHPSLSVGDVVEWDMAGYRYWLIMPTGFRGLLKPQYENYIRIPMRDRAMATYKMKDENQKAS